MKSAIFVCHFDQHLKLNTPSCKTTTNDLTVISLFTKCCANFQTSLILNLSICNHSTYKKAA